MKLEEQAEKAQKHIEALTKQAQNTPVFAVKPIIAAMAESQCLFNRLVLEIAKNGKS